MTPRLLIRAALSDGVLLDTDADQARYLRKVLRLSVGDAVEVFDGAGLRCSARIEALGERSASLRTGAPRDARTESPLAITVAQCLSTADKMDWTIEKAVELGAAAIVPLQSRRATVRLDGERARKRHEHWQRVIEAACMQCGRDRLPPLAEVRSLDAWLSGLGAGAPGMRLILDPRAAVPLSSLPAGLAQVTLLAGPESGFADEELASARAAGFVAVALGPRVLRTETAAAAAIAALQFGFGDM